ncbi:aspartyl protease family protein [Aquimarina pacifica]|uniref:aspartyl protease family protein n=1 Tax=Aquimarina pacifica TaxID=1296415 RepID=UPI0004B1C16C|nr:aspartyl protease family protein [Aquimarina pacifica]
MEVLLLDFYHFLKSKVLIAFLFFNVIVFSQNKFSLPEGKKNDKIRFVLANNLIIVPVMVNGVELSFILDSGVGSTIIFSVDNTSSLELKNATKIYLRGLGEDGPVEAIRSTNNELKIGKATSPNHKVYLVLDKSINFSTRMGFPVHGIIGYDFFKDFVLNINYSSKILRINDPESYVYKKCKKCYETNLNFVNQRKRPLVALKYKSDKGFVDVNLLLDSGSGSSIWLFENEEKGVSITNDFFRDFLGKGFNGEIYGRRTKIDELHIGDFKLEEVTASFPDSIYIKGVTQRNREGTLGGNVLRRFNLIVDYPSKKITFKKNNFFDKPFNYNMSGLSIQHVGFEEVAVSKKYSERSRVYMGMNKLMSKTTLEMLFNFILLPKYEISDVRPDSPADLAGLKKGDVILQVNGKKSYDYKLSDLNDLFYYEEGKKISIKIERLGVVMKYEFYLKKVI